MKQSEKVEFLRTAINKREEIAAFHLNDTFLNFADTFYKGKSTKTAMVSFKKLLQLCNGMGGTSLMKAKVDKMDRAEFGIRKIWTLILPKSPNAGKP